MSIDSDAADDAAQIEDDAVAETKPDVKAEGEPEGKTEGETEGESEGEPEGEPESAEDPQRLMKWVHARGNRDQTSRFANDGQYIDAFDAMQTRLSERDEDAVLGRQLRESGRQDDLLKAKQPETKTFPGRSEIELWEEQARNLGENAPADLVAKLKDARKQASDAVHQLVSDPEGFLKPHIDKMSQGLLDANAQMLQQQSAAQQLQAEMAELKQSNPWIYANNNIPPARQQGVLSPAGKQIEQDWLNSINEMGHQRDDAGNIVRQGIDDVTLLKWAFKRHNDTQAGQRKATRTPKQKARRSADVAGTIPKSEAPEDEEYIEKMIREQQEREAAAAELG